MTKILGFCHNFMRPKKTEKDIVKENFRQIIAELSLRLYYLKIVRNAGNEQIQAAIRERALSLRSSSEDQIKYDAELLLIAIFHTLFFCVAGTLEKPIFWELMLLPVFADKSLLSTSQNVLAGKNVFNEKDTFIIHISTVCNENIVNTKRKFDEYKDILLRDSFSLFSSDQTLKRLFINMLQEHDRLAIAVSYIEHGNDIVKSFHKNSSTAKSSMNDLLLNSLIPFFANKAIDKIENLIHKNKLSKHSVANLLKGKITNSLIIEFLAEGDKGYDAEYKTFYRNVSDINTLITKWTKNK